MGRCSSRTPAEKINEAEAWEELESKDAQERLKKAGEVGGSKGTSNLEEASTGETAEKVAQKVGVSKNTYRNGKKVKDIATRVILTN